MAEPTDLQLLADVGVIALACKKYGKADTHLVGVDGNALALVQHTAKQLRRQCGWPKEAIDSFYRVALSHDYATVIATCCSVIENPTKGIEEYAAWEKVLSDDS